MAYQRQPPKVDKRTTRFLKGVNRALDPRLIGDDELAEAVNFLPTKYGRVGKVKVWRKDLVRVAGTTDDRVFTGEPSFADGSADHEAGDALLPTFDNFRRCHYFYTNNFDDSFAGNAPLVVAGDNWTPAYQYIEPQGLATILAGLLLSNVVLVTNDDPLVVTTPIRQNGTYDSTTHEVTAALYRIDGVAVAGIDVAVTSVDLKGDGALGRLEVELVPTGADVVLEAGEYYLELTQSTDTPLVDGYSFLTPPAYSPSLYGWAEIPQAVTGEAVGFAERVFSGTGGAITLTLGHTFAETPITGTEVYSGVRRFLLGLTEIYLASPPNPVGWTWLHKYDLTVDFDAKTVSVTVAAHDPATTYHSGDVVSYGGAYYVFNGTGTTPDPSASGLCYKTNTPVVVGSFGESGSPVLLAIANAKATNTTVSDTQVTNTVTVDYFSRSLGKLAELNVYQRATREPSRAQSAVRAYKATRYARKNEAMSTAAVRTENELDVHFMTDGAGLWTLYEAKQAAEAAAGELLFGACMLNTETAFTKWRTAVGVESAEPIDYYLPKFLGEIRAFWVYQKMAIFGGVGGAVAFDLANLLEAGSSGKVNAPWSDIVHINTLGREDSEYLTNKGASPINVHPPTIETLAGFDDNPGRLIFGYRDRLGFTGGTSSTTLGDVTQVQALARLRFGDNTDEMAAFLRHGKLLAIFTKGGGMYYLAGEFPSNAANGLNTLQAEFVRQVGRVTHVCNTTVGWDSFATEDGRIWKLEGREPEELEFNIGAGLDVLGLEWDDDDKRLWVSVGASRLRSYTEGGELVDVEQEPGSWVYDTVSESWWFVKNPLDEDARTDKPAVFRSGNRSWSVGYYRDTVADTWAFYVDVDNAGTDRIVLHKTDEASKQPADSTAHATSSTAELVTREYDFANEEFPFVVELLKTVRDVFGSAVLYAGSSAAVSVVYPDGTETVIDTVAGDSSFADCEKRLYKWMAGEIEGSQSFQLRLSITSPSPDEVRDLTVTVALGGVAV